MTRLWPTVNRTLTWFHRWAGVVLCIVFALWFVSGAVLHFVGFPSLSIADRLASAEAIDFTRLTVEPVAALTHAPDAQELRLVSVEGRPTYLASAATAVTAIAGDTGEVLPPRSAESVRRIAEQFGRAQVLHEDGPFDYDQWTVHQQFDRYRPFYRVRLGDDEHTELHVSARTGEVLQRTRGKQRAWNWCGAILHWIYFTPVRKSWPLWNQLVWWVSLVALVTSVVGTWLGIVRMLATRAAGRSMWSPFRGWMRWHHLIGLFASVVVLTWIFSGWLSMDHGRLFSRGGVTPEQTDRMRGLSLAQLAQSATLARLRSAEPATEITLNAVAGRGFLTLGGGHATRLLWLDTGQLTEAPLSQELLLAGARAVWPQAVALTQATGTDASYRMAESVSADAMAVRVTDASSDRAYIDRESGRLLVVMDSSRRAYAWVYYCLHTLNFPGLIAHPMLRTTLIVALMAFGLIFSITGVVLGVRRTKLQFR